MKNLKALSTTALITRIHGLETAARYARNAEAQRIADDWKVHRDELNSRPTDEVLQALRGQP